VMKRLICWSEAFVNQYPQVLVRFLQLKAIEQINTRGSAKGQYKIVAKQS
jgi:hypothetical protein